MKFYKKQTSFFLAIAMLFSVIAFDNSTNVVLAIATPLPHVSLGWRIHEKTYILDPRVPIVVWNDEMVLYLYSTNGSELFTEQEAEKIFIYYCLLDITSTAK
jgi:hypothetical protein